MAAIDFYYPFDSIGGDRKVTAATERRFFAAMYTDGVVGDGFAITQTSAGVFKIGVGVCVVGGCVGGITTAKSITAKPAAGATFYICIRANTMSEARQMELVATGDPIVASVDALEAGGYRDMVLYSVTGQANGTYGVLDQRTYCTSFDGKKWQELANEAVKEITASGKAGLAALKTQFDAAAEAIDVETAGAFGSAGRQGFINPQFAVNQRGQAEYSISSGSAYTFDRWRNSIEDGVALLPVKVSRVVDGQRVALKVENRVYGSVTTAAASCVSQEIERGVTTFCAGGRQFTVSFDAKADAVCRIAVEPVQFAQVGGAGVAIGAQVVDVGTEWQRFSLTFTGTVTPTAEQMDNALKVAFYYAWMGYADRFGSNNNATRTVYLANMQINEGPQAMACYARPYADELEACQRYYVALGEVSLGCGATLATNNQIAASPVPITRRLYRKPDVASTDRVGTAGKASIESSVGGWRHGLPWTLSSNSVDAPVFVVTNTDSGSATRVCFGSLALDAEMND